jgi:ABC-type dipeptide/oligopeptide/nickel transport system permease subunit
MAQATAATPKVGAASIQLQKNPEGLSQWGMAWRRFRKNKAALFGSIIVIVYVMIAFLAPILSPHSPLGQNSGQDSLPPAWVARSISGKAGDWVFPLGTDSLGRDLLSRIIYGTRTSITVGLLPTIFVLAIGTMIGFTAGLRGGSIDNALMRVTDIFYALPVELMLILIFITLGDTALGKTWNGVLLYIIGIAVVSWSGLSRLMRGSALTIKSRDFVDASRSMGASNWHIIFRHIFPNSLGLIAVWAAFAVPRQIIAEAILGFIGIGLKPALELKDFFVASWGRLFLDAYANVNGNPSFLLIMAIVVSILVICFTFMGDGLRDALDPKSRQ